MLQYGYNQGQYKNEKYRTGLKKNLFDMRGKIMIKAHEGISLTVHNAHFLEAVFVKEDHTLFEQETWSFNA